MSETYNGPDADEEWKKGLQAGARLKAERATARKRRDGRHPWRPTTMDMRRLDGSGTKVRRYWR